MKRCLVLTLVLTWVLSTGLAAQPSAIDGPTISRIVVPPEGAYVTITAPRTNGGWTLSGGAGGFCGLITDYTPQGGVVVWVDSRCNGQSLWQYVVTLQTVGIDGEITRTSHVLSVIVLQPVSSCGVKKPRFLIRTRSCAMGVRG